jgi:hypothetical protein
VPVLKYQNIPNNANGQSYRSLLERDRHNELLFLEKAKQVRNVRREVPYRLEVNGHLICKYVADFVYEEKNGGGWQDIVEDTKGAATMTPVFNLKKKLMLACHGIDIRITVSAGGGATKEYKKKIQSRPWPKGRKVGQ